MKVQEGKTYEVRDPKIAAKNGRPSKITIEKLYDAPGAVYNAFSKYGICYTTEGRYFLDDEDSYMDLVKEVSEPIDLEEEKFMENRSNEVDIYDGRGEYVHTEIRD